jgi:hypothetical protein
MYCKKSIPYVVKLCDELKKYLKTITLPGKIKIPDVQLKYSWPKLSIQLRPNTENLINFVINNHLYISS